MFKLKISLFSKTKSLEAKIDNFHDKIIDSATIFRKAVNTFFSTEDFEDLKKVNKQIQKIEHQADALRREIENQLYAQNLLPNLQADILKLIESLDEINNHFDKVVYKFYIERPEIPENLKSNIIKLCN